MSKWFLRYETHLNLLLLSAAMIGLFGAIFNIGFLVLTVISAFAWLVLLEVCIHAFVQSHKEFQGSGETG